MDDVSSVVPSSITPDHLRALTHQVSEGALTPLQASEQVARAGALLTSDAEHFFSEVLRRGGAPVANLILDHLSMLRVGHTSASIARYLGNSLLDYATDPDVSRKILSWHPDFVDVDSVMDHVRIEDESDLAFYQELLRQLIRDVSSYRVGDRVSRLLIGVLHHATSWVGRVLEALDQVQTEIDLDLFLKTAAEVDTAKEVLFPQLPLIGRIGAHWSRSVEWILRVYPDRRRIEALAKLLEQNRLNAFTIEEAFVLLARELKSGEVPAFIQLLEHHRRQEDWPTKVVIELLYNPKLSLDELVDSQRSFSLYRNVVNALSSILDRTSNGDRALDIKRLFTRILEDTNFSNLDVSTYSSLLYEVSKRKGQGDLNPLRIQLLERIDLKHANIFTSAFFEALRGYFIEPPHAQRLLEKMVRYGKIPFPHETEFLIQVLECVGQETFTSFTLRYSQPLFESSYQAEKFYLALATTIPERFAPVYMLNRRVFRRSFPQYSDADKQIYKLCWPYLSFGQRLKAFLFG